MESERTNLSNSILHEYVRYSEFKRLLNQVVDAQKKSQFKSLSVLSEYSDEGKTFFSAVMALGYATLLQRRVLIVNTTQQTRIGALYLDQMFSAPPANHTEFESKPPGATVDLISSDLLERESGEESDFWIAPHIARYQRKYDLILFDTCALNRANKNNLDPVIIAKNTQASILVLSEVSIQRDRIEKMKSQIQNWSIPLIGAVFNSGARK